MANPTVNHSFCLNYSTCSNAKYLCHVIYWYLQSMEQVIYKNSKPISLWDGFATVNGKIRKKTM